MDFIVATLPSPDFVATLLARTVHNLVREVDILGPFFGAEIIENVPHCVGGPAQ